MMTGILCAALVSCTVPNDLDDQGLAAAAKVDPARETVSFENHIKPLLQNSCLHCHNGATAAGDLDLRNRELAFRHSPNGPFIVPGYPERSKIFRMVRLAGTEPGAMPPTGHGLSSEQIALLKGWIAQGAAWPEGEAGELQASAGMQWRSQ